MTFEVACSNSIGTSFWKLPSVCARTGFLGLVPLGPEVSTVVLADLVATGMISS